VEITKPASGFTTLDTQILVSGRTSDTQTDAVDLDVNGSVQTFRTSEGSFEAQVPLALGANTIRALADGISSEPITIVRKPQPVVRIESPSATTRTTRSEIEVVGAVENSEERAVTLDVNGTTRPAAVTNARFSATVPLVVGRNIIHAMLGGAEPAAVEVSRLETSIAISSPSDGYTTDLETVIVSGMVENSDAPAVTLKSYESSRIVAVQNGSFTAEVGLYLGDNIIQASVGDGSSDRIVVHRKQPPVIITLTSPQSGSTSSLSASVRGTIQNSRGNTLTLIVNGSPRNVPVVGGGFAAEVRLGIGENHLRASQGDAISNEIVLNRPPPPTLIKITSPTTGSTQDSSVRVTGSIANPRGLTITLRVNGSPQVVSFTGGGFAAQVGLVVGDNRIQASQGDAVSNEVVVTRVDQRTLIRITSPETSRTQDASVTVTGTVANPRGETITLTVNGSPRSVPIRNGGFAWGVKLRLGDNRFQASQGDAVSNDVVISRIVQTGGDDPPGTSDECSKINCDCKNVRGPRIATYAWPRAFGSSVTEQSPITARVSTPPQDRQAQCRSAEETLRRRCRATGKVSGACPLDASGPNAWPSSDKKRSFSIPKKQGVNKP
jgi:hypothetical protein